MRHEYLVQLAGASEMFATPMSGAASTGVQYALSHTAEQRLNKGPKHEHERPEYRMQFAYANEIQNDVGSPHAWCCLRNGTTWVDCALSHTAEQQLNRGAKHEHVRHVCRMQTTSAHEIQNSVCNPHAWCCLTKGTT